MFTTKVLKPIRKLWDSRATAKPSRPGTRPQLETLEDRAMLSASPLDPQAIIFTASPPAVPTVAAITSYVTSMMELRSQIIATIEQDLNNALYTVGQVIAQEVSAFDQQWDRLLGITPPASNPSLPSAVAQPSSGSGAGQGHVSGSGSGSGATTTAHENPHPRLEASADVSGSGSASLSGPYSGSATVTGQVWLDDNGDGGIDDNEMDYAGDTVSLWVSTDGGSTWSIQTSTTTSGATQGYNYSLRVGYGYPWPSSYIYKIQVAIPSDFYATLPGTSQIDAQGYSQTFSLSPGGTVYITGGLCSMDDSTLDDDPNGPLPADQDKVTLRDAIETGNEGGGIGHGSTIEPITFLNPSNGDPLSGTISLGATLPTITKSYNIDGSGDSTLAVSGNSSYGIFTVGGGVTSTISGLTIEYASNGNGGGIDNSGILTLLRANIMLNKTTGNGGGINNGNGWLWLLSDQIGGNTATGAGGGLYTAGGTVTIGGATEINGNTADIGGGIFIGGGTVKATSASIYGNLANFGSGGGIYVDAGSLTMTGKYFLKKNQAPNGEGGGMKIAGGKVTLSGGSIQGNTTGGHGGGIYNSAGALTIQNKVKVLSNTATKQGGGLFLRIGSTTSFPGVILDCSFFQNAAATGPGVYREVVGTTKAVINNWSDNTVDDIDDPGGVYAQGP